MNHSSPSTPLTKMIDVESHGKALERHSSCITSALGIFLGSLENERAWWYAIVPGDLNEASMSRLLGITELQWLVCLRAMKCITFTKKKDTDELVLTVKVDKIKTLKGQFGLSTLEIERRGTAQNTMIANLSIGISPTLSNNRSFDDRVPCNIGRRF
jgi:hypothetical protein